MSKNCFYKRNASKKIIPFIFILIVGSWSSIAVSDDDKTVFSIDEAKLSQLKDGKILVNAQQSGEQSKGMVEATVLIYAPAEIIWKIMTDCPEAPTFVPGLQTCKVLDSGRNWEIIRHEVKWVWFFPRITYVFRADYQVNKRIDFIKIKGDLREMKGSWRLYPLNKTNQTIVHYEVYLDPSFFIPQWLVKRSLMNDLPNLLDALRTKVRSSLLN